ncbi:hypothetical protein [Simkania sp.]|uniref:hypothetical protein n=1 Tax=Simkania sp. TaxID=34094 RepID=UPI003B523FEE
MQLLKLFLLSCLFIAPLVSKEEEPPSKVTYVYKKEIEGRTSETTWILQEKDKNVHIQGISGNGETLIITSPPVNTQCFSYQSKNEKNEYYIHRDGPYLFAKRSDGEQVTQKEFNIGDDFWIQEFDFTFRPFILSTADSLKFYIVHPTKLSLHHMIATKSSRLEQVKVQGETHDAIKVKVTLTGFKKMFWKAELWFERNTGDLLKYMANEGPNTPMSVITLFSKKEE